MGIKTSGLQIDIGVVYKTSTNLTSALKLLH